MDSDQRHIGVAVSDGENSRFHVALKTKNVPGALGDVATRFGKAGVNILSTSNYSGPADIESRLGFFVEAPGADVDGLTRAVLASPYVLGCTVRKGGNQILVDDSAFPTMYFPSGRGVIFPQTGMVAMFQEITKLFGTGGHSILYHAGHSAGAKGAEELAKLFGEGEMVRNPGTFTALYAALGWGRMDLKESDPASGTFRFELADGFESSGAKSSSPSCHFTRGLVAGSTQRITGRDVECVEESCAASGGARCVFAVRVKGSGSQ